MFTKTEWLVGYTMGKVKDFTFINEEAINFASLPLSYEIELIGDTISKKNSPQIVYPKKKGGGRGFPFIMPSNAYKKWHKKNVEHLKGKVFKVDWQYPIQLTIQFFRASKRSFDYNNMGQGVQDILVDCGIIRDDSIHDVVPVNLPAVIDRKNPRCIVTIKELNQSEWEFKEIK